MLSIFIYLYFKNNSPLTNLIYVKEVRIKLKTDYIAFKASAAIFGITQNSSQTPKNACIYIRLVGVRYFII